VKVAQVPLEPRNRLFSVPVTINGHAISMQLDTGGTSLLFEETMRRLGIVRDARFYTAVSGLGGGSANAVASIDSMSIGGVRLPVDRIAVSSLGGKPTYDGVLGLDILRDFDLDIDAPNRTLTLYRIRWCERADPPWDEPMTQIADISTRMGWLRMPFEVDGLEGTATVDTGASHTMITPRMVRRLGITDQILASDRTVQLHVIAGDDVQARIHRFHSVRIGPLMAHDVSMLVLAREPPTLTAGRHFADGVIGQDFLSSRRVWFSLRTGRLFVSRKAGELSTGH
jgi:predicted aspartyl protease